MLVKSAPVVNKISLQRPLEGRQEGGRHVLPFIAAAFTSLCNYRGGKQQQWGATMANDTLAIVFLLGRMRTARGWSRVPSILYSVERGIL